MNERLRKDDLDALGGMVNLVGTYMNDFVNKTDTDARRKLFAGGRPDPRKTLTAALYQDEDDPARVVIPDNSEVFPATPEISLPEHVVAQPIATNNIQQPHSMPHAPSYSPPEPKSIGEQLEFDFMDQRIKGLGNVRDVITHFNNRLDKIEESIKLISERMATRRPAGIGPG